MRNAKIVCTRGPATNTYEQLRTLIEAGMNVARMNFRHGTHDDHAQVYANIRRAAEDLGKNVAVLLDLPGPKIRLRRFADGPPELAAGEPLTSTPEDSEGSRGRREERRRTGRPPGPEDPPGQVRRRSARARGRRDPHHLHRGHRGHPRARLHLLQGPAGGLPPW